MHANNLIVNNGSTGKTVKGVAECFPNFDTVAATAFVIKAIYAINSRCFMVSPQNEEVFWILDFVGEK
jgi:hypothetical protein